MLRTAALPSFRLAQFSLAHISLALVGLMWVLPFLHYRHQYPLTTFDQEWWSALLGLLALTLLAGRSFWQQPAVPRIVQLPATLIVIVLVQWLLHKVTYFDQALLYVLYLLFALLLMVLGARLRERFGLDRLAQVLAIFLLIGAEFSALIGVLQHFRWHTPLDSVVVMKVSASVFGNLAQPNHFANYIALGLISLGLLQQQKQLRAGTVVLLALPLLLVMTLSGSRSSWLYLLMMSGLAWWFARRDASLRPLVRYSVLLLAGFGLMHLVVQLPFMAGAGVSIDTMHRLFGEAGTNSIRFYLWREACLMFSQSPWIGTGVGQFSWQHFQLVPVLRPDNISGLYNNAHNLIFQIAAEMGSAGLLALFGALGVWFRGVRKRHASSFAATPEVAHWWGYAALGVLAIHNLLEYPLWYAYFIGIGAVLLGALDETRYRLELRDSGRLAVFAVIALGLVSLVQLRTGYQQLRETLMLRPVPGHEAEAAQRTRSGLVAAHAGTLLTPYAELFMSSLIEVNDEHLQEKLAMNTRVLHFVPSGTVASRQALLLARANQPEQARVILEQAIWSYPDDVDLRPLSALAEKDPAHYAALLEFALQKKQEHARAVRS
ncbi:MAG TPA: Wzy polymerase domain-containing protein [Gallionella sp.]|nr:Wzy polymerase domain-containing protein [Gallionella sp.]